MISPVQYLNPFRLYRSYIWVPIETFILNQYLDYKKKTGVGINNVKELLYKIAVILVFLSAILWISVFMYIVFYYTYMPNVMHVRPVHFQFKSCDEQVGICSFPSAHVQLTKKSHILMPTQPYRIKIILDMPESQVNKDLGMFMICAQMRATGGVLVSSSCRSAMLRHRSKLHQLMRIIFLAPLLLTGFEEEKQQLQVELFSDFEDDPRLPVTDAYVELQSRWAHVYASELRVEAHFAGLRYLMYHWPNVAAVVGISTNLFFVTLIFVLSWYHLQDGLPDFARSKYGEEVKQEDVKNKSELENVEMESDADEKFFDGDPLLEEFRQLEEPKTKED